MSLSEAVACFRCDRDIGADGGVLYIEGEAYGEPPFGEMTAMQSGAATVRYACMMASGKTGLAGSGHRKWKRQLLAYVRRKRGGVERCAMKKDLY